MEGVSTDNMVAILFGIRLIDFVENVFGALAVEGQLFTAFQHGLVVVIQFVFGFTQDRQVAIDAGDQHKTAPDGDHQPDGSNHQHFRRQHRQIPGATHRQDDALHEFRQTHKGDGDIANIAG